jgi:hypothetical protein
MKSRNNQFGNFLPKASLRNKKLSRYSLLGGIFAFVFSVQLAHGAVNCSQALLNFASSREIERFAIPTEVLEDLETFQLVVPTMTKKIPLSFYASRALENWLKNPLTDVREIKKRQDAIRYLANTFARNQMNAGLFRENLAAASEVSRGNYTPKFLAGIIPFGIFYTFGGIGAVTGNLREYFGALALPYMIIGLNAGKQLSFLRNEFSVTKKTLASSKFWADSLNDPEAPTWIKEWVTKLQSSLSEDYSRLDSQLQFLLSSHTTNLAKNFPGAVLDYSLVSALTLSRPISSARNLVDKFGPFYEALGEFEVLLWFADFLSKDSNLHFPEFVSSDHAFLDIRDGHDPYIYFANSNSRPSSISLSTEHIKLLFETGPNGRGKSVTLSMAPSLLQWGMIGAPVPVKLMRAPPLRIFTSLDIRGNKSIGRSHFQAQANRAGQIYSWLEKSTQPTLVVLDEFYRGTTFLENRSAELATLEDLSSLHNVLVIEASHTRDLSDVVATWPHAKNIHVSDSDEPDRIYRLEDGPSQRINAVEEMKIGGVPERVLNRMNELMKNTKVTIENF